MLYLFKKLFICALRWSTPDLILNIFFVISLALPGQEAIPTGGRGPWEGLLEDSEANSCLSSESRFRQRGPKVSSGAHCCLQGSLSPKPPGE